MCPNKAGQQTMGCVDTILDAIKAANVGGETTHVAGVPRQTNGRTAAVGRNGAGTWRDNFNVSGIPAAVDAVAHADVAVLVVGIDTYMEGEGNDRLNTSLSFAEKQLAKAVLKTGKPVVVVVVHGGSVSFDTIVHGAAGTNPPSAVIDAGYLCDSQRALADLMFGARNRWGKLAYTIYREAFALEENKIPTALDCNCTGTVVQYKVCQSHIIN